MNNQRWSGATMLLVILMTFACLFSPAANAQLTFSADAINGKVVDEETGAPLAGVIIVAKWTIYASYVGYGNELLNVMETVTDKDGNYSFPAWGPKLLPITAFPFSLADLMGDGNNPAVIYYKSGYWPTQEFNDVIYSERPQDMERRTTPLGGFKANGKTIKLKKWDGENEAKYYDEVRFIAGQVKGPWKSYPRLTLAIAPMYQLLYQKKIHKEIPQSFPIPHVENFPGLENLSPEDEAYLKGFAE